MGMWEKGARWVGLSTHCCSPHTRVYYLIAVFISQQLGCYLLKPSLNGVLINVVRVQPASSHRKWLRLGLSAPDVKVEGTYIPFYKEELHLPF